MRSLALALSCVLTLNSFMAFAAQPSMRCAIVLEGDNVDFKRLELIQDESETILKNVRTLIDSSFDRRVDVEVIDSFRRTISPYVNEMSNLLRDPNVMTDELLSSEKGKRTEKVLIRASKKLEKLGQYAIREKTILIKYLDMVPGRTKDILKELSVDVRDKLPRLQTALREIEVENRLLVNGTEKVSAALIKIVNQVEKFRRIRDNLQSDDWDASLQTELKAKARKEIIQYTDRIIEELIQVQLVASSYLERSEQAIDRNNVIIHEINLFVNQQVPLMQSMSSQPIDLSPMLKPDSVARRTYNIIAESGVKSSQAIVKGYQKTVALYRRHKRISLFLAIAALYPVLQGTGAIDYAFPKGPVIQPKLDLRTGAMQTSVEVKKRMEELRLVVIAAPYADTQTDLIKAFMNKHIEELSVADASTIAHFDSRTYETSDRLTEYFKHNRKLLSVTDVAYLLDVRNISAADDRNSLLESYAKSQISRLTNSDLVRLSELASYTDTKTEILKLFKK